MRRYVPLPGAARSSIDDGQQLLQSWLLPCCLCLMLGCFVGPAASQSCSSGVYGPHCNYSCNTFCYNTLRCVSLASNSGGCSDGFCTKGYAEPPLCQTPCGRGLYVNRFSFNCSSICHCIGSVQCDTVSGNCATGCDPAWVGPGCQTQLPAMRRPPTIASNDCSGLVVTFVKFNSSVDSGSSSIDYYTLQTDGGSNGGSWSNLQNFLQVNPDPYSITLPYGNLSASLAYRFRLMAHYDDRFFGALGPASAASDAVRPVCIPTTMSVAAPTNIPPLGSFAVSIAGPALVMSWNSSQTPTVAAYNVTVTPQRTGDCAILTGPVNSVRVPASAQGYNFNGAHWTTYQVSVFSIDNLGRVSTVLTRSYATSEARPTTPVSITLLGKGTDGFNFTWSPPACESRLGAIIEYQYTVYEISAGARVEKAKAKPTSVLQVPVTGLIPFTTYNITVSYSNSMGSAPDAEITLVTDAAPTTTPPSTTTTPTTTTTSTTTSSTASTTTSPSTSSTSTTTASSSTSTSASASSSIPTTSIATSTISSAYTTTSTSTHSTAASLTTAATTTLPSISTTNGVPSPGNISHMENMFTRKRFSCGDLHRPLK